MKFEHLLKVYWSKNFLYGGKVLSFNTSLKSFFKNLKGLSAIGKKNFAKRFELNVHIKNNNESLGKLDLDSKKIINMHLARLTSINNSISELVKYNLIRLYLLKTFRGRAQAIGKPSRGQRTWSNSWNAYKCNRTLRLFISQIKKIAGVKKLPEKINFKQIKKKIKKKPFKIKIQETKKKKKFMILNVLRSYSIKLINFTNFFSFW